MAYPVNGGAAAADLALFQYGRVFGEVGQDDDHTGQYVTREEGQEVHRHTTLCEPIGKTSYIREIKRGRDLEMRTAL